MELLLKWIGGKKRFANFIIDFIKNKKITFNNFFEPFVGSGAISFNLIKNGNHNCKYHLNDFNEQLINFYRNVAENPEKLINQIKELSIKEIDKERYYFLREEYNQNINEKSIKNSALFYLINKTCFNGIYRVNSNGLFNTPCGSSKSKFIFNKENNFKTISKFLWDYCKLTCLDWIDSIKKSKKGDLIYLDPPYYIDSSSMFIGYTDPKFDKKSYEKMLSKILQLTEKGINVLLSNSNSIELLEMIKEKFKNNFERIEYNAKRTINPKVSENRKKDFIEALYYFKGK